MVPKLTHGARENVHVLELCCFEWFQNTWNSARPATCVLELCCFEWFQNPEPSHLDTVAYLSIRKKNQKKHYFLLHSAPYINHFNNRLCYNSSVLR